MFATAPTRPARALQARGPKPTDLRKHCSLKTRASARAPGLLVELDSVAVDLHMDGHRVAFNRTFHDYGYDCASWTPPIYHDLLNHSDGSAESLVARYFDTIGWPLTVPDAERGLFTAKMVSTKEAKLKAMLAKDEVPLRPGFLEVLEAAVQDGAIVAGIAGTLSTQDHDVAASVLRLLPPHLAQHLRILTAGVNTPASSPSDDPAPLSFEAALSSEAAKMKQEGAARFVEALGNISSGKPGMADIMLDPSLAPGSALAPQRLTAQWFLAVSAALGMSMARSVVLVGTTATCQAAAAAGGVPVAVPRKMAKAAEFPGARQKFDDMGSGGATWSRLSTLVAAVQQ